MTSDLRQPPNPRLAWYLDSIGVSYDAIRAQKVPEFTVEEKWMADE